MLGWAAAEPRLNRGVGSKMKRALVGLLIGAILPSFASAQMEEKCLHVLDAMRYALKDVDPKNFAFSLKRQSQTYYILFLSKSAANAPDKTPWRLIERQGESTTYCLVGAGEGMQPLMSMHAWKSSRRYGMPGSGHPRCSTGPGDVLPGSTELRFWANSELGESTVFGLNSSLGSKDYVLLISKDGYWILLDVDRNDLNQGCYLARGDGSTLHEDFVMREK